MNWIDEEAARRKAGERRPLTQSQHAEVNAHHPGATLEYCVDCGEPTGRAGKGEDSLYCEGCQNGPRCEACDRMHPLTHEEHVDTLRAERDRYKEALIEIYRMKVIPVEIWKIAYYAIFPAPDPNKA